MRASIPIEKALSPFGDVLLAYEMNDCEELPRDHGYPLRVIVPGHVGVRNVKWLSKIKLCSEEADGPWNRGIAYKGFGPGYSSVEGLNIDSVPTMQEMPIQSVVAEAENISLSLATTSKNDNAQRRRRPTAFQSLGVDVLGNRRLRNRRFKTQTRGRDQSSRQSRRRFVQRPT